MASSPDILQELPWLTPSSRKMRKDRLWRHGRSALLLGAFSAPVVLSALFGWGNGPDDAKTAAARTASVPAVIDSPFAPKALRPLSIEEAEKWNSAIPKTAAAVAPASAFAVSAANALSLGRSLQCMTQAIYYEAGNEPVDGQRAVAQVILNRMRSPAYPHSVCGVVYQGSERKTGCQFTFTCDGSLARVPSAGSWTRASAVAAAALGGYVYAPVGWATHYHADYVVPYWAQTLDKLTTIGHHIFYRWKARSGTGAAFTSRYAGVEPEVAGRSFAAIGDTAATPAALDGSLLQVSSAERPMIAIAAEEQAALAKAGKDGVASPKPAVEAQRAAVSENARWVIGRSGARRPLTRSLDPALRQPVAVPVPVPAPAE